MVRDVCIIEDFILPALKTKQFGYLLEWVDENMLTFRVLWSHKSGRAWTKKYFAVFLEWDRLKGRISQDEPGFCTDSKGRFRSALNRLRQKVIKIQSRTKGYRYYQLKISGGNTKHGQLTQELQVPIPYSCLSPTNSTESDDSEDLNCKNNPENCNEVVSEKMKNESECMAGISVIEEYDCFVPNNDQYHLDAINDFISFHDFQESADTCNLMQVFLEDEDGSLLDTEVSTLNYDDIEQLFTSLNAA